MQTNSRIGLAVGPVDVTHWGQVLVLPNAYGIIEVEDPQGKAQDIGVAALSTLGEGLSSEVTSLQALEELADRIVSPSVRTAVLLVPVGQVVYLVLRGSGTVYVKRKTELASLMHNAGGLSGEVKDNDTFLLASKGFSDVLTRQELTGLFDHLTPADIAEKLTLLLHEKQGGEGSVALVFEIVKPDVLPPTEEGTGVEESVGKENDTVAANPKFPQAVSDLNTILLRVKRRLSLGWLRHKVAYIRQDPRRARAALAVGLICFFAVSVLLGIWKQASVKKNQRITAAVTDAQHAFDEGVALLDLNPVKGRQRLTEAKGILDPVMSQVSDKTLDGRKVETLYRQITDNLTQAMQVTQVPLTLFYDAALLKSGAAISSMSRDDDTNLALSDQTTGAVYELDIGTKNAQIIGGGPTLAGLSLVGIHGDSVYVLTPDGVSEVYVSSNKTTQVIKKSDQWGMITALATFGGNIYLLDTQKSRIWKYVSTDTGFSELREYLNPDTFPDLSRVTGMAIDGSIWLGTTDGNILKFTQGRPDTFTPKGIDPPLGSRLVVYTSDDADNLYVLDSQKHRVVILDKTGTYLAQYTYPSNASPTALAVFEKQKKILLLSGGKLYGIDLK